MPAEQISKDQSLWKGILTGAASCLAAVILLLPAAEKKLEQKLVPEGSANQEQPQEQVRFPLKYLW